MIKSIALKPFNVAILFIVTAFLIWNILWLVAVVQMYGPYVKAVPKNEIGIFVKTDDEGYSYSVKKPAYLFFTGNLGVVNNEQGIDLIIWPSVFAETEYGVRILDGNVTREIMIDRQFNPLPGYNDDQAQQLVKQNKEKIEAYFEHAERVFGELR